ncbi:MAG: hypothetical protein WDZ61_00375, partial [Parcubacteria group bacterium]
MSSTNVDLKGNHLVIAVPAYDGKVPIYWVERFVELFRLSLTYEFKVSFNYQAHGALITNNRNIAVAQALETDCTHLCFIDSDILFDPKDLVKMMAVTAIKDEQYDIVCGPYPLKQDEPKFHCDTLDEQQPSRHGLWPIKATGCGFMMIKREVLDKMVKEYPELEYYNNFLERTMWALFHQMMTPRLDGTTRYLGEDVAFCKRAVDKGVKIWLDPRVKLGHIGTKTYDISLSS